MADDAHRQTRGASDSSLELLFKGLRELERRQRACEDALYSIHGHIAETECQVEEHTARLDEEAEHHARTERVMKDVIGVALTLKAVESQATAASGEVPQACRPGRPQLRVIMGGLAVAFAGVFLPAGVHAVAHHHLTHTAAVRCRDQRGARCADADGGRMDG